MISDLLSQQRFHGLGLYPEFFRGIPVEHQLAVNLPGPGREIIGVALSRGHRDFSDQDRALLSVLRAPLTAALLRARRRRQAGQVPTAMAGSGLAGLTEREIQILRLVTDGRTNATTTTSRGLRSPAPLKWRPPEAANIPSALQSRWTLWRCTDGAAVL